jgi:hypothetical protein
VSEATKDFAAGKGEGTMSVGGSGWLPELTQNGLTPVAACTVELRQVGCPVCPFGMKQHI